MSSSDISKGPNPQEERRRLIIDEILETERNYVRDLQLVRDKYIRVVEDESILTKEEIAILFSNIEGVFLQPTLYIPIYAPLALRNTNEEFCRQLEAAPDRIGRIFLDHVNLFKLYAVYCSNQPRINTIIKQFSKMYPSFHKLVEGNFTSETRFLGLEDFLIMPMQRITKYPLLLKSLVQVTSSEDEDRMYIEQSIERMANIVSIINERTRRSENVQKLANVEKRIVNGSQLDIVSENRVLIHEGKLKIRRQVFSNISLNESYAYLFNDKIMICERENASDVNSLYSVKNTFLLSSITNITSTDTYGTRKECTIDISLLLHDGGKYYEKKYKMKTPTPEDRDLWVKKLKEAMDARTIDAQPESPRLARKRVESLKGMLPSYKSVPLNLNKEMLSQDSGDGKYIPKTLSESDSPRQMLLSESDSPRQMFRRSISLKSLSELDIGGLQTSNPRDTSDVPSNQRTLKKRHAMVFDFLKNQETPSPMASPRLLSREELYSDAILGLIQSIQQVKSSLSIHQSEKLEHNIQQYKAIGHAIVEMMSDPTSLTEETRKTLHEFNLGYFKE